MTTFSPAQMSRISTREEVQGHSTRESLWCIIDSRVYDLTGFAEMHPGGEFVLQQIGGTDATTEFYNLHRHSVLEQHSDLCIGTIANEHPQIIRHNAGDLSVVPYAEPAWLAPQFKSPYYNKSHHRLRKAMRLFTDTHIWPEAQQKEVSGKKISEMLIRKMAYVYYT